MQEKTKTKTITQTVYAAMDGTEFNDKYDCINYENDLRRQKRENSVEDLRLDVLNDWPDVAGPEQDIEYLYFRINTQKDIDRVRTAYNGWFWAGEKIQFCKPDVLCLVDDGTTHWYWLSNLVKQAKDFVKQFGEVSFD